MLYLKYSNVYYKYFVILRLTHSIFPARKTNYFQGNIWEPSYLINTFKVLLIANPRQTQFFVSGFSVAPWYTSQPNNKVAPQSYDTLNLFPNL